MSKHPDAAILSAPGALTVIEPTRRVVPVDDLLSIDLPGLMRRKEAERLHHEARDALVVDGLARGVWERGGGLKRGDFIPEYYHGCRVDLTPLAMSFDEYRERALRRLKDAGVNTERDARVVPDSDGRATVFLTEYVYKPTMENLRFLNGFSPINARVHFDGDSVQHPEPTPTRTALLGQRRVVQHFQMNGQLIDALFSGQPWEVERLGETRRRRLDMEALKLDLPYCEKAVKHLFELLEIPVTRVASRDGKYLDVAIKEKPYLAAQQRIEELRQRVPSHVSAISTTPVLEPRLMTALFKGQDWDIDSDDKHCSVTINAARLGIPLLQCERGVKHIFGFLDLPVKIVQHGTQLNISMKVQQYVNHRTRMDEMLQRVERSSLGR